MAVRASSALDGVVPLSTELLRVMRTGFPADEEPSFYLFEDIGEYARLTPQQGSRETVQYRQKHNTLRECLFQWFGDDDVVEHLPTGLNRGEYHPLIWRNGIAPYPIEGAEAESIGVRDEDLAHVRPRMMSLHRLQKQMTDVFEVVTPGRENAAAHGTGIHQVLALAAFEIEALLSHAFAANSTSQNRSHWFSLAAPMRLAEWEAVLPFFPEWKCVRPFANPGPNGIPGWWTAYNKLKHEPALRSKANLEAAISATCAVRILLEAHFGPGIESLLIPAGPAEIEISQRPRWSAEEVYFAPLRGEPLRPIPACE